MCHFDCIFSRMCKIIHRIDAIYPRYYEYIIYCHTVNDRITHDIQRYHINLCSTFSPSILPSFIASNSSDFLRCCSLQYRLSFPGFHQCPSVLTRSAPVSGPQTPSTPFDQLFLLLHTSSQSNWMKNSLSSQSAPSHLISALMDSTNSTRSLVRLVSSKHVLNLP